MGREYARLGAKVVLTARRASRLEDLASEIGDGGGEALALACDVTDPAELKSAVAETIDRFGRVDHVQANAGFGVAGWVHKLSVDDFRRQLETNVIGVLNTVQATRAALVESRGCLALMGSVNSYVALPGISAYSMSKHAVAALAMSLRHELGVQGVSVTLVAPGFVRSEIRRVDNRGRLTEQAHDPIPDWLCMDADKAARKIVRAVRRGRRVAVITGHGKLAVFLQRHFPGLTFWLVGRFGIRGRREPTSK